MSNRKDTSASSTEQQSERRAEQRLIDHYQSQQISSDKLHTMLNETQASDRNRWFGFGLAASFVLLAVAVMMHQSILASQRSGMVLREAALNHSGKMRMDAEAQTIAELQNELDDLMFEIKLPDTEFFQRLAVVGGRYCTMSGNRAAHLKLMDPETSAQYSLFLTPSARNIRIVNSDEAEIEGVGVKLWRENDVVYALASNTGEVL